MGETKIEWATHVWTPIVGCDAVSPACAFCYAALMAARLEAMGNPKYAGLATRHGNIGKWTGEVRVWEPEIEAPLRVRKPARWFLTSMGDVGHERLSTDNVAKLFGVMAVAGNPGGFFGPGGVGRRVGTRYDKGMTNPRPIRSWGTKFGPHVFLVLTKRQTRMLGLIADYGFRKKVADHAYRYANDRVCAGGLADDIENGERWPLPNVLIGCTAEDQVRADERRPHMEQIAAAGWRTFVSYEPALGQVDWSGWEFLSWLISGGESGQHARPSHPDWHREARDFCAAHSIPYMFKQWGEWAPIIGARDGDFIGEISKFQTKEWVDGEWDDWGRPGWMDFEDSIDIEQAVERVGKKAAGRTLDGRTHDAIPEVRR